ncbi:MAG: Vesicle trafficking between the ER and Golgi, partial [Paramarteilia canceri]
MVTDSSKAFLEKVKHFIPSQKQHYIANTLQSILKSREDAYFQVKKTKIFHPKLRNHQDAGAIFKQDVENCKTIIVYVVGGGSYYEYQNIKESLK